MMRGAKGVCVLATHARSNGTGAGFRNGLSGADTMKRGVRMLLTESQRPEDGSERRGVQSWYIFFFTWGHSPYRESLIGIR
jgi:hypothetical protein